MNNRIQNITVFGGTGMLGKPVVRELVKAGFSVTAMVRDAGRSIPKLPKEISLVEGDLQNREDISRALQHADGVYLNLSVRPDVKKYAEFIPERDGLENVLAVVKEINKNAGIEDRKIRRVGAISSIVQRYQGTNGFDWWVFEIKHWAINALRSARVPTTIFYPSSFMETFDQGGIMQGSRLMLAGKSHYPMYFIAGSDYGKMVAEALRLDDGAAAGTDQARSATHATLDADNVKKGTGNTNRDADNATQNADNTTRDADNARQDAGSSIDDTGKKGSRSDSGCAGGDCEYDIQGTEGLTMDEAAMIFLKNYRHGPLKITKVPMWLLKLTGLINSEIHYLSHIMEAINNYAEPKPDGRTWQKLGRPKITLDQYARKL